VPESSRAVIERFYAALEAFDVETLLDLHHEDCVVHVLGRTPVSGRFAGREGLAEVAAKVFEQLVPDQVRFATRWRIVAVDGDCVVAFMQGGGPTLGGVPYDQTYCQVFHLRDGRIAEMHEFLDTVVVEAALFGNHLERPQQDPADPFTI
jgi:uncharacterized protein